jgi:hypothetical protein
MDLQNAINSSSAGLSMHSEGKIRTWEMAFYLTVSFGKRQSRFHVTASLHRIRLDTSKVERRQAQAYEQGSQCLATCVIVPIIWNETSQTL